MKMLVTGANGMLGQDLCPYFEKKGYEILRTDYDTLDICNEEMTKKVISNYKPDVIIHCAAYTNVDKAEDDIENAHKINVVGAKNVAKVVKEINATMVYISTDYVLTEQKTLHICQQINQTQLMYTEKQNMKASLKFKNIAKNFIQHVQVGYMAIKAEILLRQ